MKRQIFVFSVITDDLARDIIGQLLDYDSQSNEEITMFINSPGGYVTAMFSIIDMMNVIASPIRTVTTGIAASAAAIIASSGKKRLITENGRIMIHEIWSIVGGTISQMEDDIREMTKEQQKLLKILSKNTGKSVDQIKAMIKKADRYFEAKEAINFGLIDDVIKENSAQELKLSEGINGESYQFEYKDDALSEIQLLRAGNFYHNEYGAINITGDVIKKIVENFEGKVRGIDISIDYTHENESGERPAACWIKSLEMREESDGPALYAKVEFTPKGKNLVQEKEYKYASADFVMDYVTESGNHVPYVLRGGTLTNRPFIKEMNPIKLSENKQKKKEIKPMNKEAMLNALKEQYGLDVVSMEASNQSLKNEIQALQNQIKELNKLPAEKDGEIKTLKDKLLEMTNKMNQDEKERAFNSLVAEGKATPAQKEKVLASFETAEKILDFYKDAPVIIKKTAEGNGGEGGEALTEAEQALVNDGTLTKEAILENRDAKKVKK